MSQEWQKTPNCLHTSSGCFRSPGGVAKWTDKWLKKLIPDFPKLNIPIEVELCHCTNLSTVVLTIILSVKVISIPSTAAKLNRIATSCLWIEWVDSWGKSSRSARNSGIRLQSADDDLKATFSRWCDSKLCFWNRNLTRVIRAAHLLRSYWGTLIAIGTGKSSTVVSLTLSPLEGVRSRWTSN